MTAAERQRRRRARLQGDAPPKKRGRPRLRYLEVSGKRWRDYEIISDLGGITRASARRGDVARRYQNFGEQVLRIDSRCEDFSRENSKKYRPLKRKRGILEQLGRHAVFIAMLNNNMDVGKADAREIADLLLEDGDLNVKEVVAYLQWLRRDMQDYYAGRGDWADKPD
jgi:hypothetical protein